MTAATHDTLTPRRLNHYAIPTVDMTATHEFWSQVMGCEFIGAVRADGHMMSTGEQSPAYLHSFYAFSDGSCIAFFELATGLIPKDDGVPGWAKHLALSVDSREEVARWKEHLEKAGVDLYGEVDHGGIFYSLYFTDPTSGQRVELTYQAVGFNDDFKKAGYDTLREWAADKEAGKLTT